MIEIYDWISLNHTWFFSGIGVFLLSCCLAAFAWIVRRRAARRQRFEAAVRVEGQSAGNDAIIAGRDVNVFRGEQGVRQPDLITRPTFGQVLKFDPNTRRVMENIKGKARVIVFDEFELFESRKKTLRWRLVFVAIMLCVVTAIIIYYIVAANGHTLA